MQVQFNFRDARASQLRGLAEERLRFVLRRLATGVPVARVHLSDVNGPRGGMDKRCQVELTTEGSGRVVVTSVAADWRTALDQALTRAARFLMRLRGRSRDVRRRRAGSIDAV